MIKQMDDMVTRHIATLRMLEQMQASSQVVSLFEKEYQKRIQELSDVLDEIDFSQDYATKEEEKHGGTAGSDFKSCMFDEHLS